MGKNYFDEAYVEHEKCWVSVDELRRIRLTDRDQFESKYNNDLYCPDCRQARLELEFGAKIKCLRTLKGGIGHLESCQYADDVNKATRKQVQEYIKTVNHQTIENNLWHLLFRLGITQTEVLFKNVTDPPKFTFEPSSSSKKKTARVYIPQHKIKNEKDKFDYGIEMYYYGEVNIEKKDKQLKIFSLENNQNKKPIFSFFVKKESNIPPIISKATNDKYRVAFFGKMKKVLWNEMHINNLEIEDERYILVKQYK